MGCVNMEDKRVFSDTYELISVLGEGGSSTVYLAEHKRLHTKWAVKKVKKAEQKGNALEEARLLQNLHHEMLPRVVDVYEDEETIYIVEEYIEGITMKQYLEKEGPVEEQKLIGWFRELCGLLVYLHGQQPRPVIYRDMKPDNIMILPSGGLKLIDFGIAEEREEEKNTDTAGTHGYAAPEQTSGNTVDERADIYALGVTMYQMLTGKGPNDPPYHFLPVRQWNKNNSEEMEKILLHCLEPMPDQRYASAKDLLADLQKLAENAVDEKKKPEKKSGKKPILFGILGVLIVGVAAYLIVTGIQKKKREEALAQAKTLWETGQAQLEENQPEDAIASFDASLEINPEDPQVYVSRGDANIKLVDTVQAYGQAVQYCEAAQADYNQAQTLGDASAEEKNTYAQKLQKQYENAEDMSDKLAELGQLFDDGAINPVWNMLEEEDFRMLSMSIVDEPLRYDSELGKSILIYPDNGYYWGELDENGQRTGHSLWTVIGNDEFYYYYGEWENDLPNGTGNVECQQENNGNLLHKGYSWSGTLVDGYFDGEASYQYQAVPEAACWYPGSIKVEMGKVQPMETSEIPEKYLKSEEYAQNKDSGKILAAVRDEIYVTNLREYQDEETGEHHVQPLFFMTFNPTYVYEGLWLDPTEVLGVKGIIHD